MKILSKPEFGSIEYRYVQNPKLLLVFALTVFLFLNLTFAAPSQIMIFSSVYGSSNTNEADQSDSEESTIDTNTPTQDEEQRDNNNDLSSSPTTLSEQGNRCSSDEVLEPSFIDENGCPVPCPSIDSQTENMPEGCPQLVQQEQDQQDQQPSQTSNNLNNPSTNDNNSDTNIGFLDSGAIERDTLKGKDVILPSVDAAHLTVHIVARNEVSSELRNTISVCIDTVTAGGKTVSAVPYCMSANPVKVITTQKFAVEPGQIIFDIKNSRDLILDSWTCLDVNYLVPKESQTCTLIFNPSPQDTAIVPKPNSDYGKSMIGP